MPLDDASEHAFKGTQTSYHSIDSTRSSDSRRRTRPETQMGIRDAKRDAIFLNEVFSTARDGVAGSFNTTDAFIAFNWCSFGYAL
jgi:hypothetical protein